MPLDAHKNHCFSKTFTGFVSFLFNGQEKDDEIFGITGSALTAEFWEYDSRLGRRWNIDPVFKYWESPYACFMNSPLLFVDPQGSDGVVTVDKEKHEMTVKVKVYYWEKNSMGEKQPDATVVDNIKSNKKTELGFDAGSWLVDLSPDPTKPEMWTVTYEYDFVGITAENSLSYEKKAKENIKQDGNTSNYLLLSKDKNSSSNYQEGSHCISINPDTKNNPNKNWSDYNTFNHEGGHAMGMPHDKDINDKDNKVYNDNNNGGYEETETLGIMSYARNRETKSWEVRFFVTNVLSIANQSNDNSVNIHLNGKGIGKSTIMK
jgi:hypothetical protein